MKINDLLLQKVAAYKPDAGKIRSIADTPLVFVVGIAGAGKDTTQRELLKRHSAEYQFIVSHTTRKPRTNNGIQEQDGVDYHFIDLTTAEKMLDEGQYVEANIVHYEDIYGTAISEIQAIKQARKIAISDIEVKGIDQYIQLGLNVKPVFIIPPSFDVWWERFQGRYKGQIDWYDALKRMRTALEELDDAMSRDYYYIVVNDELEKTVESVHRIALGTLTQHRTTVGIETLRKFAADMAKNLESWRAEHTGL
ncbi:MAG TPA: hypothetical protein VF733_03385 [Candidatus Saccharimonadales bacterium]